MYGGVESLHPTEKRVCVNELVMIGPANNLAIIRRQVIYWTIAVDLSIGPSGKTWTFNEN